MEKRCFVAMGLIFSIILLTDLTAWAQPRHRLNASFDWTMADRTLDEDGNGLIDFYRTTPRAVNPSSFRVYFNACASSGNIRNFQWQIDDRSAGAASRCDGFHYDFPREGAYKVTLTIVDNLGSAASVMQDVVVQDWLIVAVGDSYGSGEGNPDRPIAPEAWEAYKRTLDNIEQAKNVLDRAKQNLETVLRAADAAMTKMRKWAEATANETVQCLLCPPIVCQPGTPPYENCQNARTQQDRAEEALLATLAQLEITTLIGIEQAVNDAKRLAEQTVSNAEANLGGLKNTLLSLETSLKAYWKDQQCHRSAVSGQAQAALKIEQMDPRTSVTFVHLSCSGTTINRGLIGRYKGTEPVEGADDDCSHPEKCIPPQIEQVKNLVGGREIDALLISIGGNDANFAPIIESCMFNQPCYEMHPIHDVSIDATKDELCSPLFVGPFVSECKKLYENQPVYSAKYLFESTIDNLNSFYRALADRIRSELGVSSNRVFITEYPNATLDDDGTYCGFGIIDPTDPTPPLMRMLPGVSQDEARWADQTVGRRLNAEVLRAAQDNGWNFIGGISDAFGNSSGKGRRFGHGYCAQNHWFRRLFYETFYIQGNQSGAVHPSPEGHAVYRERISQKLIAAFYPGGDLKNPRRPQPQTVPSSRPELPSRPSRP